MHKKKYKTCVTQVIEVLYGNLGTLLAVEWKIRVAEQDENALSYSLKLYRLVFRK